MVKRKCETMKNIRDAKKKRLSVFSRPTTENDASVAKHIKVKFGLLGPLGWITVGQGCQNFCE